MQMADSVGMGQVTVQTINYYEKLINAVCGILFCFLSHLQNVGTINKVNRGIRISITHDLISKIEGVSKSMLSFNVIAIMNS